MLSGIIFLASSLLVVSLVGNKGGRSYNKGAGLSGAGRLKHGIKCTIRGIKNTNRAAKQGIKALFRGTKSTIRGVKKVGRGLLKGGIIGGKILKHAGKGGAKLYMSAKGGTLMQDIKLLNKVGRGYRSVRRLISDGRLVLHDGTHLLKKSAKCVSGVCKTGARCVSGIYNKGKNYLDTGSMGTSMNTATSEVNLNKETTLAPSVKPKEKYDVDFVYDSPYDLGDLSGLEHINEVNRNNGKKQFSNEMVDNNSPYMDVFDNLTSNKISGNKNNSSANVVKAVNPSSKDSLYYSSEAEDILEQTKDLEIFHTTVNPNKERDINQVKVDTKSLNRAVKLDINPNKQTDNKQHKRCETKRMGSFSKSN